MTNIRVVIEDSNIVEYEYAGKMNHYIQINTANYGVEQISSQTNHDIYLWAREHNISINAWEALEDILDNIEIA